MKRILFLISITCHLTSLGQKNPCKFIVAGINVAKKYELKELSPGRFTSYDIPLQDTKYFKTFTVHHDEVFFLSDLTKPYAYDNLPFQIDRYFKYLRNIFGNPIKFIQIYNEYFNPIEPVENKKFYIWKIKCNNIFFMVSFQRSITRFLSLTIKLSETENKTNSRIKNYYQNITKDEKSMYIIQDTIIEKMPIVYNDRFW